MRILIIEDEPKNVKILKRFILDYFPKFQIVGEAQDTPTAEKIYKNLMPDLILLDIQLAKGNAFDFLDKIMPVSCGIIFITAYNQYALKAFKYSAVDYLLKPINIFELKTAMKKAEEKNNYKKLNAQLKQLLENVNSYDTKVALPIDEKLIFINPNEIMYCKAIGNRTIAYTSDNKTLTTSKTLGEFEEILSEKIFFRVHNSYLININFIIKYTKGRGGIIEMQDSTKIEVASRRKEEFLAKFNY